MLASLPAVGNEVFLPQCERLVLKRRRKGIVPAVEESELRDHRDDLPIAPVLAQLSEHLVGDPVRHVAGGKCHVERDALSLGVEWARAVFPHRIELDVVDPRAARGSGGVRHTVAAASRAAHYMGDQPLEAGIDLTRLRVRDCSRQLQERAQDFRPALHDEYPVRDEAAAGGVEDREDISELGFRRQRFKPGSGFLEQIHGVFPPLWLSCSVRVVSPDLIYATNLHIASINSIVFLLIVCQ